MDEFDYIISGSIDFVEDIGYDICNECNGRLLKNDKVIILINHGVLIKIIHISCLMRKYAHK